MNDLFLFIKKAKLVNFEDNNTIYANTAEMERLLNILEKESETAIKRFKQNQMIVNPDKFQAMVLGRHKQKEKINLNIDEAEIKGQNSVTLLRVEIDNELNFNNHISNICKKAGNKINAISRIQSFLGQKEKEALVNTFYSNFNYCSLVWHFSTKKSTNKIEKIQEHCLKLLYDNTTETYDDLLVKTSQSSMEIKCLRSLATEIFKTLNDINPNFAKKIFYFSLHKTQNKYDLFVHRRNTTNMAIIL